jgi:hypothetical protein
MSATKGIEFGGRFFWAYDVAAGIFLKHLTDEARASREANAPWLVDAVSDWQVQAAVTEFGLTLEENWSASQRLTFIELAERVCQTLATRESIPAEEIAAWPLVNDLHIFPRTKGEVLTAPVIELGHAIIAIVHGNLPRSPRNKAWFYGTPSGRSTIRMEPREGGW